MSKVQRGFTLIELIVVIVILGILAATALPRFINIQSDARIAAVQGMAGALRSAQSVVQAKWFVAGSSGLNTNVSPGGSVWFHRSRVLLARWGVWQIAQAPIAVTPSYGRHFSWLKS